LILLVGGLLAACAGPRTQAVDAEAQEVATQLEDAHARLEEPGLTPAQVADLQADVERLRSRLVELTEERARAMRDDTRDVGTDTLWRAAELLLLGGAGAGAYRRRSKTRAVEVAAIHERIDKLEAQA